MDRGIVYLPSVPEGSDGRRTSRTLVPATVFSSAPEAISRGVARLLDFFLNRDRLVVRAPKRSTILAAERLCLTLGNEHDVRSADTNARHLCFRRH